MSVRFIDLFRQPKPAQQKKWACGGCSKRFLERCHLANHKRQSRSQRCQDAQDLTIQQSPKNSQPEPVPLPSIVPVPIPFSDNADGAKISGDVSGSMSDGLSSGNDSEDNLVGKSRKGQQFASARKISQVIKAYEQAKIEAKEAGIPFILRSQCRKLADEFNTK